MNVVECDNVPEVPVTVTAYVCSCWLNAPVPEPQPLIPLTAAMPAISSNNVDRVRLNRLLARRILPAKGSRSKARENGASLLPSPFTGCAAAEFTGNCMDKVTAVVPAPAARVEGEKL